MLETENSGSPAGDRFPNDCGTTRPELLLLCLCFGWAPQLMASLIPLQQLQGHLPDN